MKRKVLFITMAALALLVAPVLSAGTWTGRITDAHCGAKGAKDGHQECALKCAKDGAALVFYNNADQKIYKLDNQEMAKEHLKNEVVVTGEAEGDSITVTSIVDKTE